MNAEWIKGYKHENLDDGGEYGTTPWYAIRNGERSRSKVWDAYADNLRYALDSVETLIQNLGAERVVITSDHANCMGEFGVYGHPKYVPHPTLKRVSWAELTATDTGEYRPEYERPNEKGDITESGVTDRLEAIGYK